MYVATLIVLMAGAAMSLPADTMTGMMGKDGGMMDKMMKPCCPPKQWQAVLVDLKSQTGLQYATLYAYDGISKTEGSLTIPTGGTTPVYQTFTDYNTMKMYSVSMFGDPSTHKCEVTNTVHNYYDNCFTSTNVDSQAKFIGNSTFGGLGMGLKFDAWEMTLDGINVTIALGRDGCVPIVEKVTGKQNGKNVDSIILFNDFSDTITTKELVTMPPACVSKASPVVG